MVLICKLEKSFASYPGRHQANRYGFWAKHRDDLYFEGDHSGIDAAFVSDKDGNGILITGDSLSLNYEQTDQGIVLTVNASVHRTFQPHSTPLKPNMIPIYLNLKTLQNEKTRYFTRLCMACIV